MKKVLFINACIREESRTLKLCESFLNSLDKNKFFITEVDLSNFPLMPLTNESLERRNLDCKQKNYDSPYYDYAKEFKDAQMIVIGAPFWDLSFPSVLKVYIENVSIEGLTFTYNETGLVGLASASNLVFITTRGGIYTDSTLEQGVPYIKAISKFFGINNFDSISCEGLDIYGNDEAKLLEDGLNKARNLANKFNKEDGYSG